MDFIDLPAKASIWLQAGLSVAIAVIAAIIVHRILFFILRKAARRTSTGADELLVERLCRPLFWLLIAFALSAVQPALPLSATSEHLWLRASGLVTPALFGWLVVALLGGANDIVLKRTDISDIDNLKARRRRTRAAILHRIAVAVVLLITFCMMLMSIPSVRSIGVTLIASAGLAGLAVGAAAQPALKNLIAGIQMAFTEPIRIDDVVIMDGEWGRIEEIRLTYVVVKIWDERRLIVPVSKFLEDSFQNWTLQTSQILGSVFWYLDPTADVARLRARLEEVVKSNPRWDGRFFNMQVTDTKPGGAIEVRALMTAKDASLAFDLRCDVREAMLEYIRSEMPEALLRYRTEMSVERRPIGAAQEAQA